MQNKLKSKSNKVSFKINDILHACKAPKAGQVELAGVETVVGALIKRKPIYSNNLFFLIARN